MKTTFVLFLASIFLLVFSSSGLSQIDILKKVKDKVEEKTEEEIDEGIDAGLDKAEEEVKEGAAGEEEEQTGEEESEGKQTRKDTGEDKETDVTTAAPEFKSYSKFDFIPGEQIIFFEDFSQDNVGDFPAKWNTNASGEVYNLNNYPGNWFGIGSEGVYIPEGVGKLPENFTMEFDLIHSLGDADQFQLAFISTVEGENMDALVPGNGGVAINFGAYGFGIFNWAGQQYGEINNNKDSEVLLNNSKKKVRVSLWFQKQRVRLWVNQTKYFDIPRAVPSGLALDRIRFTSWDNPEPYFYLTNIRIAAGAPDMRSKLITEGKLVTRGILFDVNSDKIKPESYGTLKEIAKVLSENADVKVKIIGHTDSDGSDASNLDLSKRRAASVKNSLSSEFGIDASRMETDGKGEGEPATDNNTPEGKANNRRVEFIKM